jgi:TolB protein
VTRLALLPFALLCACPPQAPVPAPKAPAPPIAATPTPPDPLRDPRELHLRAVRQLSFGGRASWPRYSADGKQLLFLEEPLDEKSSDGGLSAPLLRAIDTRTGKPTPIAQPGAARGVLRDLWRDPGGALCADLGQGLCGPDDLVNPAGAACSGIISVGLERSACAPPAVFKGRVGGCAASNPAVWACLQGSEQGPSLWLADLGHPPPGPLLTTVGWDASPAFSPDGKNLAWSSSKRAGAAPAEAQPGQPAPAQIYVLAVGSGATPRLLTSGGTNLTPAWFPNSARILFSSNADDAAGREFDLSVLSPDGTSLQRVTFAPGADLMPTLSPDGHELAWVSERNAARPSERDLLVADWVD